MTYVLAILGLALVLFLMGSLRVLRQYERGPSPVPNAWRIGSLTMAGVVMGICLLAFCTGVSP
jgi:hypothetical protein